MGEDSVLSIERIAGHIFLVRGEKVMMDSDLAALYGIETKNLNKAVTRNLRRFPDDFMFRLSKEEWQALRFQAGTSNEGRGGRRYPPRVFTEQGVAMLSSVLRSDRAIDINVTIMRAFVRLRRVIASNAVLADTVARHDNQIEQLFEMVKALLEPSGSLPREPVGFQLPSRTDPND